MVSAATTERRATRTRNVALLALLVLIALAALFALGYIPHTRRQQSLVAAAKAADAEKPLVSVVPVKMAAATNEVVLPGSMQALMETPVYARADGYLKRRLVDIGDKVRAGQLLAEIETPEIDQQVRQAQATVEQMKAALEQARSSVGQAQANRKLAEVTLKRWSALVKEGVLSPQSGDEKQSDFDAKSAAVRVAEANVNVAQANITSVEANLKRLTELKGFARVTAPFNGVITERNVDVGALIASGGNAARSMFTIAQIDTLRIFVNVPQTYTPAVEAGQQAAVTVKEAPNRVFPGKVSRDASSLDEKSHTLLTEILVDNASGRLRPGMYAQVRFKMPRMVAGVLAPSDALVLQGNAGYMFAVRSGRIHRARVTLGRDFGSEIEVLSGLNKGDEVIRTPGDDLREGEPVEVVRDLK